MNIIVRQISSPYSPALSVARVTDHFSAHTSGYTWISSQHSWYVPLNALHSSRCLESESKRWEDTKWIVGKGRLNFRSIDWVFLKSRERADSLPHSLRSGVVGCWKRAVLQHILNTSAVYSKIPLVLEMIELCQLLLCKLLICLLPLPWYRIH